MADASSWNSTIPSGNSEIRKGDDLLRSHWSILEATWEEDHFFVADNSGASAGQHRPKATEQMFRGVRVTKDSDQKVPDNTASIITFTSEDYDVGGFFDAGSNASEIIIPSGLGGFYNVGATVNYENEIDVTSTASTVRVELMDGNDSRLQVTTIDEGTVGTLHEFLVTTQLELSDNSKIYVRTQQNSGSDETVSGDVGVASSFFAYKIG